MERPSPGAGSARALRRCCLGPKLLNRCRSEKKDTKKCCKMLKIILKLEEGRVPDRNAKGWKVEEQQSRATGKECTRLREEFEVGGFMAQQGLWDIAKKRM